MHVGVVGGGIVGLAVARALRADGHGVTVFEKSPSGNASTGRNSGVIHSGLYYPPGGLKARLCVAGAASMAVFARERDVPVEIGGKLVVAVHERELAALAELERRGGCMPGPTQCSHWAARGTGGGMCGWRCWPLRPYCRIALCQDPRMGGVW